MVVACNRADCKFNEEGSICKKDIVILNGGACSVIVDRNGCIRTGLYYGAETEEKGSNKA